jgi:histidinol-phosphate aminotransferase
VRPATEAIAARHGRRPDEVLVTAGAAEAFALLARNFSWHCPTVVHPQFTEPERLLRSAGADLRRVVLEPPFAFAPEDVPATADLVVVGNPTNPTSVLHPAAELRALVRPGRVVVVDEAFADCDPAEPESLAADPDVVVVRSLTKTWGLAGVRIGYVLGPGPVVERLAVGRAAWPVGALAVEAAVACSQPEAVAEARAYAQLLATRRRYLVERLNTIPAAAVANAGAASFVLVRTDRPRAWERLRHQGFAVRRGDTFPGLDEHWIRVAVRDEPTSAAFADALEDSA